MLDFDVLAFDAVAFAVPVFAFAVLRVMVCVCADAVLNGALKPRSRDRLKRIIFFMWLFC